MDAYEKMACRMSLKLYVCILVSVNSRITQAITRKSTVKGFTKMLNCLRNAIPAIIMKV